MNDLFAPAEPYGHGQLRHDINDFAFRRRPAGGYRLGIIDCPWLFRNRSKKGEKKNPNQKYECVPTPILRALPIGFLFAVDSVCLSWGTSPMLLEQLDCLNAWGFTYRGYLPWFKGSPLSEGEPDDDEGDWNPAFGTGYLWRSCSEILLIGTRGDPTLKPERRKLRQAFFSPQREHSRKPDEQYTHAEALSPGPYIEIFSRTARLGWDSFGNQVGLFGEYDGKKDEKEDAKGPDRDAQEASPSET